MRHPRMNSPRITRVIVHGIVSSRDACKMVACDPAVQYFHDWPQGFADNYHDDIVAHIQTINKLMFQKQIFCSVPTVVATAVWDYGLKHHLNWTQIKCADAYRVTNTSVRKLHQRLYPPPRRVY